MRFARLALLSAVLLTFGSGVLYAQTYTWVGGGPITPNSWFNAGSWTNSGGNPYPSDAAASVVFDNAGNGNVSITTGGPQTFGGPAFQNLTFNSSDAAAYIINNTLSLNIGANGTITVNNNVDENQTINSAITLNGSLAITSNSATANTLNFGGAFTGGANNITVGGQAGTNISGVVTTTGTLTKNGNGVLALSANNAISGGITINGGQIRLDNGGTLGTGAVTNNTTVNLNRTDTHTVGNAIGGNGAVVQNAAGTTIFTTNNSYAGTTTINSGTIRVGDGGTTGSVGAGNVIVASGANFSVNRSDNPIIGVQISGAGTVNQIGSGTTILTGSNSYGATNITAGALQIGNNGTVGTLGTGTVNNATSLIFNRSNDLTVSNTITGAGTTTKNGAGTLVYTGTNSGGTTIVAAGTLGGTGTFNNAVTVNTGAAIRGGDASSIGALNVAGTTTVRGGTGSTGATVLTRISTATSGGSGTVADPFLLNTASTLALGGTGTLNFDTLTNNGKFNLLLENDAALAQFITYKVTIATASAASQFQLNGTAGAFTVGTDFELSSNTPAFSSFNNVQLVRNGGSLELTFSTVPEPATLLGLGAGVMALGTLARRRWLNSKTLA